MRVVTTLAFATLLLAGPALAKVDVDLGVLEQLPPKKAAPKPAAKPAPAPRVEKPAPPPAAPIIVEAPPAAPPPPVVIELPKAPEAGSAAALSGGADQRPEPAPTRPSLQEMSSPTAPSQPPKPVAQTIAELAFESGAAELSDDAKAALRGAARRLAADDRLRVELLAYAAVDDPSLARRVALSRALAARSFLVEQGVRTQRIEVRPLGAAPGGKSGDRIDLRLARR